MRSAAPAGPAALHVRRQFTLGVASGYPLPTGVVLWTRLAPAPLQPGGGMSSPTCRVEWEVATDERMGQVVQQGTAAATPEWAHAVHVEVEGLEPGRWYWYRFRAGGEVSPIGRTRTAPAAGAGRRAPALRVRLLPALRAGLLRRLPPHGGRRPRPGRLPRRLHLRVVVGPRARAQARRARAAHARGLSRAPRALQDGRRPAGGARRVPVDRDVGRPRGRQRLRRRSLRSSLHPREWFLARRAAAYQRVLRAHAAAPADGARSGPHMRLYHARRRSATSRSSTCSTIASTARISRARRPAAGARRRRRGLRGAPRSAPDHARRRCRSAGSRPASTRSRARWNVIGAADADGPARPQAGRRPAVLDRRLGRLSARPPPPARLSRHAQAGQPGRDRRRRAHRSG